MKKPAVQTKMPEAILQKASATSSPVLATRSTVHPILQLQRAIGNQGVQRFIQAEFTITQPGFAPQEGTVSIRTEEKPSDKSSVVPKQTAESPIVPSVDEGASKESAAEVPVGKEIPGAPATPEKTPVSPEETSAYQAVVEELELKAKHEGTPSKTPEKKRDETILAANVACKKIIAEQNAYDKHLKDFDRAQSHDSRAQPHDRLTTKEFMDEFETAIGNLAKTVPENNTPDQVAAFGIGQQKAKQDVAAQNKENSEPLQNVAKKDYPDYEDKEKKEASDYKLKLDPVGNAPAIKQAKNAAPKPETDKAISLDDKSRELDDALVNHDVGGQKINIDESSLAFPVSGERSFDDAGVAKREAQAEIARARPRYREQEAGVIGKSQNDIDSLVNVRGLQGHHGLRSKGFEAVLGHQEGSKGKIQTHKEKIFADIHKIYTETKDNVNKDLESLLHPTIEENFEKILSEAQEDFETTVREMLEDIYPGTWGSVWLDEHEPEIEEKYEELLASSKASRILGPLVSRDWGTYLKAVKIVQGIYASELFVSAKRTFINDVKIKVEHRIAKRVVTALNAAREHIKVGLAGLNKAIAGLTPEEKTQVANVLVAVTAQFADLRQTVDDRQHEIVNDMARTYNQSVGKLQGTFDAIKEDVQTSWLRKAWNKLKAVVNAIIDFATRIAELLGRIAYLVGDIVSSPRVFFGNLVTGIGQGFSTFVERIDEFLATAFFDWIRGASGVQVQLPKEWNPAGIFSLFTQLLNLSTETIWQRMEVVYDKTVANAFRRGEVVLEKGLEIFDLIKKEGLGGLWDHIKESLGTLLSDTLDEMKETVLYAAIKKVVIEIGKMLVPGGGFIAIAEKIIRLLQFIVEARNKILRLIESFVDSMEMAVKGNVSGIVTHITDALTASITIALDFLITFFGLGNLKDKVTRFIERMRNPVIRGIDWVLNKFKPFVLRVFGRTDKDRPREERQDRKGLDLAETKEVSAEKQEKAQPDIVLAKQTVRRALDSQLPEGARHLADVDKVLASVITEVKPALTNLRAEEFMPGQPKAEGAIGFKVRATLQTGKDSIIDSVRFSHKGKAISDEERWQIGVKGVKRGLIQVAKRGISDNTIKEQFPKWQTEFGFTLLELNVSKIPWVIEGEMSASKPVATVSFSIPPTQVEFYGISITTTHLDEPREKSDRVVARPLTEKPGNTKGSENTCLIAGWYRAAVMNSKKPDRWRRLHLLHSDLHGPGDNPKNLALGTQQGNTDMYKIEKQVIPMVLDQNNPQVLVYEAKVNNYRSGIDADFPESLSVNAWEYDDNKQEKKGNHVAGNNKIPVAPPDEEIMRVNLNTDEKAVLVYAGFSRDLADVIVRARPLAENNLQSKMHRFLLDGKDPWGHDKALELAEEFDAVISRLNDLEW